MKPINLVFNSFDHPYHQWSSVHHIPDNTATVSSMYPSTHILVQQPNVFHASLVSKRPTTTEELNHLQQLNTVGLAHISKKKLGLGVHNCWCPWVVLLQSAAELNQGLWKCVTASQECQKLSASSSVSLLTVAAWERMLQRCMIHW